MKFHNFVHITWPLKIENALKVCLIYFNVSILFAAHVGNYEGGREQAAQSPENGRRASGSYQVRYNIIGEQTTLLFLTVPRFSTF